MAIVTLPQAHTPGRGLNTFNPTDWAFTFDVGDTIRFPNDGRTVVLLLETASQEVTITPVRKVDGRSAEPIVLGPSVPFDQDLLVGPLPPSVYNDAEGLAEFTCTTIGFAVAIRR
jgi:hypothetical protein